MSGFAFAQPPAPVRPTEALVDQVPPKPFGQPTMAKADHHVHVKGDLTLEDALRRSRETGISYGIAINGGLGFPIDSDAGLEPFLREMEGKPADKAFQAEGREWVRLFTKATLAKFDCAFTDSMTWTDDAGKRMRLWITDEVGVIDDPQRFMDTFVERALGIFANEPIDIYVNPTYIPEQLAAAYDRLWTPARMKKIVDGLAAKGIAMEINNRRCIPSAARRIPLVLPIVSCTIPSGATRAERGNARCDPGPRPRTAAVHALPRVRVTGTSAAMTVRIPDGSNLRPCRSH